jgi:predicted TPR repeat methyltransferase
VSTTPDHAGTPSLAQAMRLHQSGEVAAALALYEALLAQTPGDATLHNFMGMAQIQLRRFDQGEVHVRRALELDPAYAEAWNSLGNLYRLAGRPEEALQAYQAMTRLAPAAVAGWVNLADLHRQMGSRERALAALATAVERAEAARDAPAEFRCGLLKGMAALHGAWGLWDEGARLYSLSLQLMPEDTDCRLEMIKALMEARRREDALREAQAWVARAPDDAAAQTVLDSVDAARTPQRIDDGEVIELFDTVAKVFDKQLAALGYRAPALIQAVVNQRLHAPAGGLVACDAGCGTGLCGPWLRPLSQTLDGVDLSQGMLDLAAERGLYDRVERAEITAWLQSQPARYGLIVAADVLCYFGALQAFMQAARGAMRPGALLAFTVEYDADPGEAGYLLQINGRYRHAEPYVRRCMEAAGFTGIVIALADELRREGGASVQGLVVSALAG